jgi:hypothetical protein
MNTEPVPTVDAEIVEPAPLDEKSAKVLDTKIRLVATNIKTNWEKLKDYIAEAKAGQIHSALGKPTWTAYLAEVLEIGWQDRDERRKIVALLSDAGMSQRAIAEAVGTSQKTVDRDLDEPSHDDSVDQTPESDTESAKVVSLDGKRRPKHPKPKREPKRPDHFHEGVTDLQHRIDNAATTLGNLVEAVNQVRDDDRYPKYRDDFDLRVGNSVVALIQTVAANLSLQQRDSIKLALT